MKRYRKPSTARGLGLCGKAKLTSDKFEDYKPYISNEACLFNDKQLRQHLVRLLDRRATPEEFKDPFLEFRERLRQRNINGRGLFFKVRKYLESYYEHRL